MPSAPGDFVSLTDELRQFVNCLILKTFICYSKSGVSSAKAMRLKACLRSHKTDTYLADGRVDVKANCVRIPPAALGQDFLVNSNVYGLEIVGSGRY